ncbi:MAG: NACHT domain-containing protein [Chloroflexi bacterium]|nr:NACHT domain-containing protein [Chloroflexota bacterium]
MADPFTIILAIISPWTIEIAKKLLDKLVVDELPGRIGRAIEGDKEQREALQKALAAGIRAMVPALAPALAAAHDRQAQEWLARYGKTLGKFLTETPEVVTEMAKLVTLANVPQDPATVVDIAKLERLFWEMPPVKQHPTDYQGLEFAAGLRAFLQAYAESIRRQSGKLPWVNTAYLDAMLQELRILPHIAQSTLRAAYLNQLFGKVHRLTLSGIDPEVAGDPKAHLHLNAVYTALLTGTPEERDAAARGLSLPSEARYLSALEQMDRQRHLVLLGDPGSGKSTFVNFVALCMAGEMLGRSEANLELLTAPLPGDSAGEKQDEKQKERQPWSHATLLPVRIILRDFAARELPPPDQEATAEHLWRFIEAELQAASLADYAPLMRRELMEQGGLILLDGLDEVPEAGQRRTQIKQVVEGFAGTFYRCRVVVTSRTYAYQKQEWRLPEFAEATLAPFSPGQIRQFVERWYTHIAGLRKMQLEDALGRAELLKRAIFSSDRLQSLAERPLLLTLMASLHAWRGGSLPEKREELYADAVDLLLYAWESQRVVHDAQGNIAMMQPSLVEWLKVDRGQVRGLLNELAFQAHAGQPDLNGAADIAEGQIVAGLMHLSQNRAVNPAQLVDYLSQRAGLLLPHGVSVYTFPHRTFQEYLAACYLTDHDFPDKIAQLACADPNRWREAVLLAGAKSVRGSASLIWTLAEALCYTEPEGGRVTLPGCWGALLAGQALVETADLSRISPQNQPKVDRVIDWQQQIMRGDTLPALERAAAGRTLARLGDPRPQATTLEGMEFCYVPAGSFMMGSSDKDEVAYKDEKPQHPVEIPYSYWIGRYPVTNAQYRAFVQAGGYARPQYWPEAQAAGVWTDGVVKAYNDETGRTAAYDYGEPYNLANHPVVGVTWYEALAFSRWLAEWLRQQGALAPRWGVYLCSEAEWEKAVRGGLEVPAPPVTRQVSTGLVLSGDAARQPNANPQRKYPWGDAPDPNRANYSDTGIGDTSAIGCFPGGASPYGVEELSGNVWEWTRSLWDKYPYPADAAGRQKREDPAAGPEERRVLRGGAFLDGDRHVRCAYRSFFNPRRWDYIFGFRVVLFPYL